MKTEQITVLPMVKAYQEPCSQSHEPKGLSQIDSRGRSSLVIHNDAGEACTATSSLIVSASRKTDLPAHHSNWFMERLRRGHLMVNFPSKRYISFDRTRLIVFWTKNPLPLMQHLDEIDAMGLNYYFQFTLNDYEQEDLEPNVPPLAERIDTFKKLSDRIGKEKVIWRFDPLVLTDTIDRERLIGKIGSLMQALAGHTEKMVFSFLYPAAHKKAERKLKRAGINAKGFSDDEKAYVALHIEEMAAENGIQAAVCAEPMDLAPYGIIRNKCIDDGLIRQLFGHDQDLMAFVNSVDGLSDKGQRPLCGCIPSIDIGTYDTCRHYCCYCYANVSETAVENKIKRISHTGELLVPPVDDGAKLTETHLGELCVKYRVERSFFGYTPRVLKSGIQKYGRRNKLMNGLWCLVEMDLFSLLEWEGTILDAYLKEHPDESRINVQRSAQRLRTNMANRLVVMMSEEVSISAWWMPIKMLDLYQKWWATRDTPESRKHLVDIYRYLLSQRMIRLISDLHSVYLLPPDYVKPKHMDDLVRILDRISSLYPAVYSNLAKVGDVDWDLGDYPKNLQSCIKGIVYNIEAGSDHVFFWINQLCSLERQDGAGDYHYIKTVWSVLHRFIDRHPKYEFVRESISALEWFFKKMTHQEKPIYLYHAILLLARRGDIDWEAKAPGIDTPFAEVESLYAFHLAGKKRPMDDYILDLHTHRGKRSGNCLENFAMEGAYIERGNVDFLRPEYREIYVTLKQELDLYRNKGLEEQQQRWPLRKLACRVGVPIHSLSSTAMARIIKAPHAKLKTAVYKKPVHIVGDLVYKGPYTFDDPRFINNLRFTYALQVLEEKLSLPEWLRASLPWQYIGYDGNDGYFLAAPNVGKTGSIPFKIASSKIETNVPVVTKGGCVRRVADIESNGQMTNEAKRIALQHLYFRFLLGIGDSGTHQILIREDYKTSGRFMAGVDIEERRGVKENGSRLDHLFKNAPSKAQRSMYAPVVDHIRAIGHHHLDPDTLGRLSAVGIDPESVKKNIEVWEGLKPF